MTTLRPQIIRADTLDLQDVDAPSAQDHTLQPSHPAPLGAGPAAPHQDAELQHLAQDRSAEIHYLSDAWKSGGAMQGGSDPFSVAADTAGNTARHYSDMILAEDSLSRGEAEAGAPQQEADEDAKEELMEDKMSSSPSIDDGGFTSRSLLPVRKIAFRSAAMQRLGQPDLPPRNLSRTHTEMLDASGQNRDPLSPSLYMQKNVPSNDHHLRSEYISTTMEPEPTYAMTAMELGSHSLDGSQARPVRPRPQYAGRVSWNPDHLIERISGDWEVASRHSFSSADETEEQEQEVSPNESAESGISWTTANQSIEDDDDGVSFSSDPRFIDSGWGGECLRDLEDIDFEFVYALHNFVATVDGQANATKGDTMVLLDDSNSYWWLVRVVKDSSIGYLPAEHIETPTERLARLNKHRNVDLSMSMLGDNVDKSKNPLTRALRRRNGKMVTFTTPTYFEPSGTNWSDEEPEIDNATHIDDTQGRRSGGQIEREAGNNEAVNNNGASTFATNDGGIESARPSLERDRLGNGAIESPESSSRTQIGTLRSTVSFMKDDGGITKKISLTPDLLRDESSNGSLRSNSSLEKPIVSQDALNELGRVSPTSNRVREEKKKKDKRPNMLSGLFKRKDKKGKVDEADGSVVALQHNDGFSTKSLTESGRGSPVSGRESPSLLLKQTSPSSSNRPPKGGDLSRAVTPTSSSPLSTVAKPGLDSMQSLLEVRDPNIKEAEKRNTTTALRPGITTQRTNSSNLTSPTSPPSALLLEQREQAVPTGLGARTLSPEPRFASNHNHPSIFDQSASAPDGQRSPVRTNPFRREDRIGEPDLQQPSASTRIINGRSYSHAQVSSTKPLTEPIEFISTPPSETEPKSSTDDSQLSTAPPSEAIATPSASTASLTPAPTTPPQQKELESGLVHSEPTWDDAALRTYLDGSSSNDVKDMLLVVHDSTDVVPLAPDHPTMLELGFHEHQKSLDEMSRKLDDMLNGFLMRRGITIQQVGSAEA